jgi:hypothetical protein
LRLLFVDAELARHRLEAAELADDVVQLHRDLAFVGHGAASRVPR